MTEAFDSDVSVTPTMQKGIVKWFNVGRGYGFIAPNDGTADVFVHISAIQRSGLTILKEGQEIEYCLTMRRGKTSAQNLILRGLQRDTRDDDQRSIATRRRSNSNSRRMLEAFFAKVFRHLSEIDALADAQVGVWLTRRHKYKQEELLDHKSFEKIESWCEGMEAIMIEWDKMNQLTSEIEELYFHKKTILEDRIAALRAKIIRRPDTLADAAIRLLNTAFDRLVDYVAHKLHIPRLSHDKIKKITDQRYDSEADDD